VEAVNTDLQNIEREFKEVVLPFVEKHADKFRYWPTYFTVTNRAPDKMHIFISKIPISSPNPMFDYLLESSHRDDSNKWSNIGFGEEITQVESIKVHFMHLIWSSGYHPSLLLIYNLSV